MKWLGPLSLLILLSACTPGQPTYLYNVTPATAEQAHPLFRQLLPVLAKPEGRGEDDLVRTWKEFLGNTGTPLRKENVFTFVYYDFTHSLNQVFLEATFVPQRKEALWQVGTTGLFYRVYTIPKPATQRYRFSATAPLVDPFQPSIEPGEDLWQPLVTPVSTDPAVHLIVGASEPELGGRDLQILLPPGYRHNLAQHYPLVVLVGLPGSAWIRPLDQMLREGAIDPIVVVSVGDPAGLRTVLEDQVVPWMRAHYRASTEAANLVLIGWGQAAKPVQDLAAARPDFWVKAWTPLADQARGDDAWNTLAPPFFRTQFPVVNP